MGGRERQVRQGLGCHPSTVDSKFPAAHGLDLGDVDLESECAMRELTANGARLAGFAVDGHALLLREALQGDPEFARAQASGSVHIIGKCSSQSDSGAILRT